MIKQLNKSTVETVGRPVRILQFGEGNFLRAFVDWQIDIANEKGVMDAGVAVCQPIIDPERKVLGMIDLMHRQDNMYHVYLEGIENKRPKKDVRLVKSIMDSFNPYVRPYKLLSKYPTGKGLGKCSLKNLSSPDLSERETGRGV